MSILSVLLLSVFGLTSVLLILLVLVQDDQGEGIGGLFGGGGGSQIGNRKGNILTKATSILGFLFLSLAMGIAFSGRDVKANEIEEGLLGARANPAIYDWTVNQVSTSTSTTL